MIQPSWWCYDCEVGSLDFTCWRCSDDLRNKERPKRVVPVDPPPPETHYTPDHRK